MAYAMGRTPAKPTQRTEVPSNVDIGAKPPMSRNTEPAVADRSLGSLDPTAPVSMEEPVDVRRLTGEWEKGLTSKKTPPPSKMNTRPRYITPKKAKVASQTNNSRPNDTQRQLFEPTTSSARIPSDEPSIGKTETKYLSRLTEARAMMSKVRHYLNSSRNISGAIKREVMDAAERLMKLVVEAEADGKKEVDEERTNSSRESEAEERVSNTKYGALRENYIVEKVEENTRLLKENERKLEEIKRIVQEQGERKEAESVTYAGMVTGRAGKKDSTTERRTLHSLVVTSQDELETGEEVLDKVRKAVEAKEGWITVERVRKAKDRKIIMGCSTREDRQKIKDKIEKSGQSLVVENMKNKDPLLVLKDVLSMHSDEEVVRALKNQNREVFHDLDDEENRIGIRYRKRTRNPHTAHIVLTVSPTIWGRATERGRLRIDLQSVFVEDQSPLVQCSKCLGYGHGRRYCSAPSDLCGHCGGPHLGADCPDKVLGEAPTCVNCKRAGSDSASHNAFSRVPCAEKVGQYRKGLRSVLLRASQARVTTAWYSRRN